MNAKKKQLVKPGDVLAIPLPAIGKVAYARVYGEGAIAVYTDVKAPGEAPPIGQRSFLFQVGVYAEVLRSGDWPKVVKDPFVDGEDTWPAPCFVQDALDGSFSLYHHGEMRAATRDEVEGLEPVAAWARQHVEDRIQAAVLGREQPWVKAPWKVGLLNLGQTRGHGTVH